MRARVGRVRRTAACRCARVSHTLPCTSCLPRHRSWGDLPTRMEDLCGSLHFPAVDTYTRGPLDPDVARDLAHVSDCRAWP